MLFKKKEEEDMESIIGSFIYYGIRLIIFAAVAGAGIAIGIKLRKAKNAKEELAEKEALE